MCTPSLATGYCKFSSMKYNISHLFEFTVDFVFQPQLELHVTNSLLSIVSFCLSRYVSRLSGADLTYSDFVLFDR